MIVTQTTHSLMIEGTIVQKSNENIQNNINGHE